MKRIVTAAIAALLTAGAMGPPGNAAEARRADSPAAGRFEANREDWREATCRYARLDGEHRYSIREVARAIECSTERWRVPGGTEGALCIARRESGLRPDADNPSSSAAGVYQWIDDSFDGAYRSHPELVRRWGLRDSVWNARTNVVLAIRHAHDAWSWSTWEVDHLCGF